MSEQPKSAAVVTGELTQPPVARYRKAHHYQVRRSSLVANMTALRSLSPVQRSDSPVSQGLRGASPIPL